MDSPARGTFENLLYDLLTQQKPPVVTGGAPGVVELAFPAGNRALLVRWVPDEAELLEIVAAARKARIAEVVLVGGPADARAVFEKGAPWVLSAFFPYHLPDGGPLWQGRKPWLRSPLRKALERGVQGPPDEAAWQALASKVTAQEAEESAESDAFTQQLAARRPLATWALAASFAAVFLLEYLAGATDDTAAMVKLGALVPSRLASEPWRLLSYSFLHGSVMHVVLNTYVLLVLGDLLERVLGSVRFLVVYCGAVLSSGLAVAAFSSAALTVGASGGVWGMLTAHAVLAYFPRGLLPQALLSGMRRAALTNLGLNVFASFLPHVSMSGHFGGGVAGAALVALPALTAGLQRPGNLAQDPAQGDGARAPAALWLRLVCAVGVGALLLSLGFALRSAARGGLFGEPVMERVALPGTGLTVELPAGLPLEVQPAVAKDGARHVAFSLGKPREDDRVYTVEVVTFDEPLTEEDLPDQADALEKELSGPVEGFTLKGTAQRKLLGTRPLILVSMEAAQRALVYERTALLDAERVIFIDSMYAPSAHRAAGCAERAVQSLLPAKGQ